MLWCPGPCELGTQPGPGAEAFALPPGGATESLYSGRCHRRAVGGLDGGWSGAAAGQVKTQPWAAVPAWVRAVSGKYSGSEFRKCQQAAPLK